MPRFVRRRSAPKRRTKWCAAQADFNVPNIANNAVADAVPLCLPTTAVVDQADPVVGWCRGQISLSRVTITDTAPAVAWAIVVGRLTIAASTPVQVFNPWSVDDLERQDILGMGHFEIPPIVDVGAGSVIDHSTRVATINIKTSRKLSRNTNNLFLWVVGNSLDNATTVKCAIRTLMKF